MAENTSVGSATISLDLEASGDLKGQIEKATGVISGQIEASLKNIGNLNFQGLADTISNTISKAIENGMKNMQQNIQKTIDGALANVKGIKVPVDFAKPTDSSVPNQNTVGSTAIPRAPPIPQINTGVNFEAIKAQIDNLTASLDINNARIEQQKIKLQELKQSYANTFDGAGKNKIQEQILKTEATINRLTAASDKAGFKLADLDAQFAALDNTAKGATAGVNAVNEKLKDTASKATKADGSMNNLGNTSKESTGKASIGMGMMGKMLDRMIIRMFLFNTVMKAITSIGTFLGSALMTNNQFANSLLQIKTNLEVAFMPIYHAVLPAINYLMSALSTVTAYVAAFTNALFGKTYQAGYGAAKNLNASISAMKNVSKQSKQTAADIKGSLAGFDEINILQMNKPAAAGTSPGAGGASIPSMKVPSIDVGPTSTAMKNITAIIQVAPYVGAWIEI
jgi:hypothetical protein